MSILLVKYSWACKMASWLSTPLAVTGIFFIIIGIILAVIGVILLIANQNQPKPWYIWLLLIGGIVLGILGGLLLFIAARQTTVAVVTQPACAVPAPIPVQYAPAPAVVGAQTIPVGQPRFDPDPQQQTVLTPGVPQRRMITGPYGPGGTQATVLGTYTPPSTLTTVTTDIPEHPVAPVAAAPVHQYIAAPAPQYVAAPAPIVHTTVSAPQLIQGAPQAQIIGSQSAQVGPAHFDPDPQRQSVYTPGVTQRRLVTGPYGPGGQQATVSGVYTSPGTLTTVTTDIPQHSVTPVGTAVTAPVTQYAMRPQVPVAVAAAAQVASPCTNCGAVPQAQIIGSQTNQVGPAQFDPDPQRQSVYTPGVTQRRLVTGPYGPGGTQATVPGVYTSPGTVTTTTTDIPQHAVIPTNGSQAYAQPQVRLAQF